MYFPRELASQIQCYIPRLGQYLNLAQIPGMQWPNLTLAIITGMQLWRINNSAISNGKVSKFAYQRFFSDWSFPEDAMHTGDVIKCMIPRGAVNIHQSSSVTCQVD